jgi:hypothetical protein
MRVTSVIDGFSPNQMSSPFSRFDPFSPKEKSAEQYINTRKYKGGQYKLLDK